MSDAKHVEPFVLSRYILIVVHDSFLVCLEGLWLNLMTRLSLIDAVHQSCSTNGKSIVALDLIALGDARSKEQRVAGEAYTLEWSRHGRIMSHWKNKRSVEIPRGMQSGWRVQVQLHTPFVKSDPDKLLLSLLDLSVIACA